MNNELYQELLKQQPSETGSQRRRRQRKERVREAVSNLGGMLNGNTQNDVNEVKVSTEQPSTGRQSKKASTGKKSKTRTRKTKQTTKTNIVGDTNG